jgi:transcriptional regulator with XRE-family HTH domain
MLTFSILIDLQRIVNKKMKGLNYDSGRLRAQRAVLRLTNQQIADKAECGLQTVSNILNGRHDNPGVATLANIAAAVNLSLADVVAEPELEATVA